MEKYHKISDNTMNKIKKAGLSVVKDQYGDYEVIADRKDSDAKNESLKSKNLRESRWSYTLQVGPALRGAIEEEDYDDVKAKLMDAYSELYNNDIIEEDDYVSWTADLSDVEPDEDELDYQLSEFYDLCDNLGVWIPLSESFKPLKRVHEGFEKIEVETDDQVIKVESEEKPEDPTEKMITPVDVEVKDEIEDNTEEVEANDSDEVVDEFSADEDEIDYSAEEFDEESFDDLGESYLKRVYENVKSYKTSKVAQAPDRLVIEGIITFNSGNQKKTTFSFTPHDATKSGNVRFLGENLQISRGHKAFVLKGNIKNNAFMFESLNYNYRAKDSNGKSTKVYGTVKVK